MSPVAIALTTLADGEVLKINQAFERLVHGTSFQARRFPPHKTPLQAFHDSFKESSCFESLPEITFLLLHYSRYYKNIGSGCGTIDGNGHKRLTLFEKYSSPRGMFFAPKENQWIDKKRNAVLFNGKQGSPRAYVVIE
ncbi:MAG: hypothetical protein JRD68_12750 [Deltaproteobacteria bacterium]|nr:hypothetical protein [Deltaproteobacteria bacterium]